MLDPLPSVRKAYGIILQAWDQRLTVHDFTKVEEVTTMYVNKGVNLGNKSGGVQRRDNYKQWKTKEESNTSDVLTVTPLGMRCMNVLNYMDMQKGK